MTKQLLKEIGMTMNEWSKLQSEAKFARRIDDLKADNDYDDKLQNMLEARILGRTYTGKRRGRKVIKGI